MRNYVTTYINPDTDGIACMIATAAFRARDDEPWVPVRFGNIDFESQFVLEKLNLSPPIEAPANDGKPLADADNIILVDTHHIAQLPKNFPYDKVIQIIDHHPKGDDDAFPNAKITNEKIGAAASLVAKTYLDAGSTDERTLRLLAFAIASNTLNFKGRVTTDFDRGIYADITKRYPISERDITDMLHSRLRILDGGLRAAIESDIKIYDTANGPVGISQLKMPGIIPAIDADEAIAELGAIATDRGVKYFALNAGDTDMGKSLVLTANGATDDLLSQHFGVKFGNNQHLFDRILARKIDFVFAK